jgi:HSP20 family protein
MMDRMFDDLTESRRRASETGGNFAPSCEVIEETNQYLFKFDLPGIPKDQVKVELVNNQLTVSAERREEKRKDTKSTHLSEVYYGSFLRSFTLPVAVDEKKADAKFENGVLTVAIPKVEAVKPKQIEVH